MNLEHAARILLVESAGHPSLAKYAGYVHGELAAGRKVTPAVLLTLVQQATAAGVFDAAADRQNSALDDAVVTLLREIDRAVPVAG